MERGDPHFLLSNCNQHDKIELFAKLKKLTATCSLMIGQFVDTMILASTGIKWL